ncbi:PHP domain-containing protein [Alkalibacter saccharofermentans]|uniref:Polymerase/histidinol phosphatase N-terminal domain-containing protein n=1 Tax=Alkalibacter saccharofermentans DSM 14828 TaxID=1120975 RepID=A0A1M4VGV6_9FIRM|nr:PHP domain-containing protein [Alkalibacter saccharofermentans]SHE68063.1 hypothetical protein SAMN02746064_00986 [Alkalibacter saccharofermentans DSM 14828]
MDLKAFAVDLHIHSCLSPCGDLDMTPNNIVNMSLLKGLDAIAVADHNSGRNLPAVAKVARKSGLTLVPGIEVNTKEEIHALAYFNRVEDAMELGEHLYKKLPDIKNDEKLFGQQLELNEFDEESGKVDKLLINAVDITINRLDELVKGLGGIIVPAHIDRRSFSIVSNLGFIPDELDIKTVELSSMYKKGQNPLIDMIAAKYRILRSSDAHYLHQILEREFFMHLDENTPEAIIGKLKEGKQKAEDL